MKTVQELAQEASLRVSMTPVYATRIRDIIADTFAPMEDELEAYRNGGVTEEILRRRDGTLKVVKGCAIVRADYVAELEKQLATAVDERDDANKGLIAAVKKLIAAGASGEITALQIMRIAELETQLAEAKAGAK